MDFARISWIIPVAMAVRATPVLAADMAGMAEGVMVPFLLIALLAGIAMALTYRRRWRSLRRALERMTVRYEHIFEHHADMLVRYDRNRRITFVNAALRRAGYAERGAFPGGDVLALAPPGEREVLKASLESLSKEKPVHKVVHAVTAPDGGTQWHHWIHQAVFRENGEVAEYYAIGKNITARRKAEAALRDSETRLKFAIEGANDGIWDWRPPTGEVYFSPRWYAMLGYEDGEPPPSFDTWRNLLHPDDRSRALALVERCLAERDTQFVMEFRMRRKDGGHAWILSRGKVVETADDGAIARLTGTHTDISGLKETEQALRASRENLRITLDSIGDGVIATDAEGRVTRLNPVARRLTGWSQEEAMGRPFSEVFLSRRAAGNGLVMESSMESPVESVLATGQIQPMPQGTVLISRDGRRSLIEDSAAPIRDDTGALVGVVLVFRDVTGDHQIQEKLQHSRKMDAVGRLAGGIAHDFNNLLGGIMGFAELLAMRLKDDERMKTYAEYIVSTTERASELTGQLLAFSRKAALVSSPCDIHAYLRDSLSILRHTLDRRIEIVSRLEAAESTVLCDPSQIQNIFLNLGVNARDAMPKGGLLEVVTENVTLDAADYHGTPFPIQSGRYLAIHVRDTGHGMEPVVMERIFEPFFTTKDIGRGSGLGLSAVHGTVVAHKGAIGVESAPGQGTVFHIHLPVTTASPTLRPEYGLPSAPSEVEGAILVIDDEPVIRETESLVLREIGFSPLMAADGEEGIAVFQEHRKDIIAVVLDMVMPKMDGEEVFGEIRAHAPNLPILIASGYARDARVDRLLETGNAGYIRKPFLRRDLAKALASLMAGSWVAPESGDGDDFGE